MKVIHAESSLDPGEESGQKPEVSSASSATIARDLFCSKYGWMIRYLAIATFRTASDVPLSSYMQGHYDKIILKHYDK